MVGRASFTCYDFSVGPGMMLRAHWMNTLRLVTATAVVTLQAACAGSYDGSLAHSPSAAPSARELTCVDVAVHPLPSDEASSAKLLFAFGNRCGRLVRLDFGSVPVEAVLGDGRHERLVASPVSGETLTGALDAHARGAEAVDYRVAESTSPPGSLLDVRALCVDPTRLEARADSAPAPRAIAPVCFRAGSGVLVHVDARTPDEALEQREEGAVATLTPSLPEVVDSETGLECSRADGATPLEWCNQFGHWEARPRIVATVGMSTHRLGLRGRSIDGGDNYGAPASVAADPLGNAQAEAFDLDVTGYLLGPLYLGGELQLGGASLAHGAALADGFTVSGGGFYVAAGALAGLTFPRIGPLQVRAEAFAGGWVFVTNVDQPVLPSVDCSDGCPGASIGGWTVEPRVHTDVWLTPWLTLGAWGGANALHAGDWSGGVAFAVHGRGFDGLR